MSDGNFIDQHEARGGICAPVSPAYQAVPEEPYGPSLEAAKEAARAWLNTDDWPPTVTVGDYAMADKLAEVAVAAYIAPVPLSKMLPPIAAPRGGIKWLTAEEPEPLTPFAARVAKARRRKRDAVTRIGRPFRRARAAWQRGSDAHKVWTGAKTALTEAQIDALSDY